MTRITWFLAGAATGVYGVVRARRVARNFTPGDIAARIAATQAGVRAFAAEVSAGMAEREQELREPSAQNDHRPALDAAPREDLLLDGHR